MGDPLSIAASVVGLVSTGVAIAKGLYAVADALASSGKEIRAYGDELDGFTKVLNLIHLELTRPVHSNSNVLVFRDIADVCAGVLEPFNQLQQTLGQLTTRFQFERSRWRIICGKIQWVFEKKKELLFWRDLLAQQHRNLHSALLVLVLQGNREGNAQIKHLLEASLEKSIRETSTLHSGTISDGESRAIVDIGSGTGHLGEVGSSNSASRLDPSKAASSSIAKDSINDAELSGDESTSTSETGDSVPHRDLAQQLVLIALNNEKTIIRWNDSGSITEEEFDEEIQRCLDPDDGAYMQMTEERITETSHAINTIALRTLYTQDQNPINIREQAVTKAGGEYMIGIVCASVAQFVAIRCMLTNTKPPSTRNAFHDSIYIFGTIADHKVVVTCMPRDGDNQNSEHEALKIFRNMFQGFPSMLFAISVGTASGCPYSGRDIRFADVVVGRPKRTGEAILFRGRDGTTIFRKRARLPDFVLTGIRMLQAEREFHGGHLIDYMESALQQFPGMAEKYAYPENTSDLLFDSSYSHPSPESSCDQCDLEHVVARRVRKDREPAVHWGPIASVQQFVADPVLRDELAYESGVLCIDREGCEVSCDFPVLVVRGIIDYADSHAGPEWVRYAALAAAAYVKELLFFLPPSTARHVYQRRRRTVEKA